MLLHDQIISTDFIKIIKIDFSFFIHFQTQQTSMSTTGFLPAFNQNDQNNQDQHQQFYS